MSEVEEIKNVVVSVVSGREFTCCGWGITFRKVPPIRSPSPPKTEVLSETSHTKDTPSKVEAV